MELFILHHLADLKLDIETVDFLVILVLVFYVQSQVLLRVLKFVEIHVIEQVDTTVLLFNLDNLL